MMKYILSTLLCIFFVWGFSSSAPEKDITEHLPFFNDETSVDYKLSDCVLSQVSNSKESGSSKALKLRQSTVLRLLNNFRTEHSEAINDNRNFNGNFIKYSCGYYVYTLKHILI